MDVTAATKMDKIARVEESCISVVEPWQYQVPWGRSVRFCWPFIQLEDNSWQIDRSEQLIPHILSDVERTCVGLGDRNRDLSPFLGNTDAMVDFFD
jgi:hypothetical protein